MLCRFLLQPSFCSSCYCCSSPSVTSNSLFLAHYSIYQYGTPDEAMLSRYPKFWCRLMRSRVTRTLCANWKKSQQNENESVTTPVASLCWISIVPWRKIRNYCFVYLKLQCSVQQNRQQIKVRQRCWTFVIRHDTTLWRGERAPLYKHTFKAHFSELLCATAAAWWSISQSLAN